MMSLEEEGRAEISHTNMVALRPTYSRTRGDRLSVQSVLHKFLFSIKKVWIQ